MNEMVKSRHRQTTPLYPTHTGNESESLMQATIEYFDPRRVVLADDDIRAFLQMMAAPDQIEWDYEAAPTATPPPVSQQQITDFRAGFLVNPHNFALWAKAQGTIVGMVGLNRYTTPHNRHCAELGVGVALAYQGQGIGLHLVTTMIRRAPQWGLQRLEAYCLAHNQPVTRLLTKAGFVQEGIRRGAIVKQGKLYDERIFGLLLAEDKPQ